MEQIDYFQIFLQKPQAVYFPGEKVIGHVMLKLKNRVKVNFLKAFITGFSNVAL